jgi:hypothetical protein
MTVFAVFGHISAAEGTGGVPPTPSVTYPIRFDDVPPNAPRVAVPRPTVSYPIRFDTPAPRKAAPAPSVPYPIDLAALGGGR